MEKSAHGLDEGDCSTFAALDVSEPQRGEGDGRNGGMMVASGRRNLQTTCQL
jgi:hypothetical protein